MARISQLVAPQARPGDDMLVLPGYRGAPRAKPMGND
jgi:hypothetical protein